MDYRIEKDSMGEVKVPSDKPWGAQTQRSLENFKIGGQTMPLEIIRALVLIKKCCAAVNARSGVLDAGIAEAILSAANKILAGGYEDCFPLMVWQTGSGTQTNMNCNEVLAHIAQGIADGGKPAENTLKIHPNDHVNKSQSTNDVFPTAIHVAAAELTVRKVLPALKSLIAEFKRLERVNKDVIKTGRTHLQDATPLTFAQEISGWTDTLAFAAEMINDALKYVYRLPVGGTAVGTGLNAPKDFGRDVAAELASASGLKFTEDKNKFHGLSSKDSVLNLHSAFKALAVGLMKISNDIRLLSSGPRTGLGEIFIPENEPGSSIMPGKVNPTQCEAVGMVAAEIIGNDVTMTTAASRGDFELNVFMPVIAFKIIETANLLADCMSGFRANCVSGIRADKAKMRENFEKSLMLATALTPLIGYERSAAIVKTAHKKGLTLREAAVGGGFVTDVQFDEAMKKLL
ncbi:MAG: class II fumarate hydratase [Clostridiaceae bacterium]|jgi:fumarate hydratase class II|nr:class II fumarate hydratase [Clostridiaceae bacterium]